MRPTLLLLALSLASAAWAEPGCEVTAAEWSRPRSAAMVLALPGVRACVRAWQAEPARRLVLVTSASEEGGLWASELRDWLVALGVPAAAIELRAVGGDPDRLRILLEERLAP